MTHALEINGSAPAAVARKWEAPCDPRPLWTGLWSQMEAIRREASDWIAPKQIAVEVFTACAKPTPRREVLTSDEAHKRALAILFNAESERERAAEEEAARGLFL